MTTTSIGARALPMIRASGLARTFTSHGTTVHAVRGVDLEVAAGEIVGFLGPNGAGKTTTLRMLTTLLRPTAGNALVAGHDLRADPVGVRRSIGFVAQGGGAGSNARVGDELAYQGQFYGLRSTSARERTAELIEQLDLHGLADRDVKTLSGGQRRRLDIALGLVHSPALVFLDEPTTGLDPQSRSNMWEHISRLRDQRGTTVFLTTHYLEEADALCDRIMVIDDGCIIAEGTPDALKRSVSGDLVVITLAGDPGPAAALIERLPRASDVTAAGQQVSFRIPGGEHAVIDLLRQLDIEGVAIEGVSVQRPTLDDVFLTLTGRTLREEAA